MDTSTHDTTLQAEPVAMSESTDLTLATDVARKTTDEIAGLIRRYPAVAVAAVVAVGFLLGRTLTRRFT